MQKKYKQIAKETLVKNKTLMEEKEQAFILMNLHTDPKKAATIFRKSQATKEMWKDLPSWTLLLREVQKTFAPRCRCNNDLHVVHHLICPRGLMVLDTDHAVVISGDVLAKRCHAMAERR